jgi:hypothetical protein
MEKLHVPSHWREQKPRVHEIERGARQPRLVCVPLEDFRIG